MAVRGWFPFLYIAAIAAALSLFGVLTMPKPDPTDPTDQTDLLNATPPEQSAEPEDGIASVRPSVQSTFYQSPTGIDAGGVSYVSPATTIHWRPETAIDSEGATVEQILAAVADRLEFVQSTPQAADRNARALWDVLKALRHFQGPTQ
jgi:hypothetical protein